MLESTETPIAASKEMQTLYSQLVEQLFGYKGKKVYGYLPKNIKETIDAIVAELAKDKRIAELYAEWNKANREKLSVYYDKEKTNIPLEVNKEFRDIKNTVCALRADDANGTFSAADRDPIPRSEIWLPCLPRR